MLARLDSNVGCKNMIPRSCIAIKTSKFPILEGEVEEIVNDGMYGKALCIYLQSRLPDAGIEAPSFICEDWGWWIDVIDGDFKIGLCVYSHPDEESNPERYAIMPSEHNTKKWSWSKFRMVDVSTNTVSIIDAVEQIFQNDSEIESVSRHDDYPF